MIKYYLTGVPFIQNHAIVVDAATIEKRFFDRSGKCQSFKWRPTTFI